jgi:hypothetical protein
MMDKQRAALLTAALACCLLVAGAALAQGTPVIGRWVVAAGGGPASGGQVAMCSTLGQPIIGPAGGDSVSLGAGYWHGEGAVELKVYLPLVLRGF